MLRSSPVQQTHRGAPHAMLYRPPIPGKILRPSAGFDTLLYQCHDTHMQLDPLAFQIHPSSGVPIYRQLMDQVKALVASGRLQPGSMLPSVRQLGQDLQINQMTVSKAYSLLEREGMVERVRGQGMRINHVTASGGVHDRQKELVPWLEQVVARAYQLGLTRQQLLAALNPLLK